MPVQTADPATASDQFQACFQRGNALRQLGRLDEALASFEQALLSQPDHAQTCYFRAVVLHKLGRMEEAIKAYDRALAVGLHLADAWNNRGLALIECKRQEEALHSFEQAIALQSDHRVALCNGGNVLWQLQRWDEAVACYDRIIAQYPNFVEAYFNKSIVFLLTGKFRQGWELYEWRLKNEDGLIRRPFAQRQWSGTENLSNKTILLHGEQGFGDSIQFCRYAKLVKQLGANVLLEVPQPLTGLLAEVEDVDQVLEAGQPLPTFDYHCPLLSLPLAFRTELHTIPGSQSYLHSSASKRAQWHRHLGEKNKLRVGLVWCGSTGHMGNRYRSLPLNELIPHLSSNLEYVSLQKEVCEEERELLSHSSIRHYGQQLQDFSDTAALCDLMDVVISVDTSVAHLAAALGRPTWILLPFVPDWRWLLEREDSPWYASVRLYRQTRRGQWGDVLERVAKDLRDVASGIPVSHVPSPAPGHSVALHAPDAETRLQQGLKLHQQGQLEQALTSYAEVIALQPRNFQACFQRGNALRQLGRLDEALASFEQALMSQPDHAQTCYFRAVVLHKLGRMEEAIKAYDRALAVGLHLADAWNNRGLALIECKRQEEALHSFEQAIALQPDHRVALCNAGNVRLQAGRWDEALACYDRLIALQPDHAEAHANRGAALKGLNRLEESLTSIHQALALKPDADAFNHCGNTLKAMERFDEALSCYDQALALRPDSVDAYYNRGNTLTDLNRLPEAIACYHRALALQPDHADARFNLSLALLTQGQLGAAWELYEWRWLSQKTELTQRHFPQPLWRGADNLAGKTILLHAEQGFGDCLQFCRYARLVKPLGARVLLEVPQALIALLHGLAGVDEWVVQGHALPAFDWHCPLMSLPLAFKTDLNTIPSPEAYLHSSTEKRAEWSARLGDKKQLRVGLVWRGRPDHRNDQHRSLALAELLPHLPPALDYVCLQKEMRPDDLEALEGSGIRFFGPQLQDFSDTAALCDLMDVVISVDTSVAHLAAALGKPTWILLTWAPEWRWLLERQDSPWYASARLYRQTAHAQWGAVLERVGRDLLGVAASVVSTSTPLVQQQDLDVLFEQGLTYLRQDQLAAAKGIFEEVLRLDDKHFDAQQILAFIASKTGQLPLAVKLYDRALAINPNHAQAWVNQASALLKLNRPQEALSSCDKAIRIKPDSAEFHEKRGVVLYQLERFEEAAASFERAIAIRPDYPGALFNCGVTLCKLLRFEEAVRCCKQGLALEPDDPNAYINLGTALIGLNRPEEALHSYEQALAINQNDPVAHNSVGLALMALLRMEEAIGSFERAIAINPDYADAHMYQSHALLLTGQFQQGWQRNEWRWRAPSAELHQRTFPRPLWLGTEDLAGKTLLIHGEQGMGDIIQFCRYAVLVKNLGARVVLGVPPKLNALLQNLAGVDQVVVEGQILPAFDFHCPMLSLPLAFKTELHSIPSPGPYLTSSADKRSEWSARLGQKKQLRVGLVWRGRAGYKNDHNRSLPLVELLGHLPPQLEYVSLQKEIAEPDRETLQASSIRHFGDGLQDFTDTAALCDLMDVVISVDTSVAHLAAALGKPTWILLPYVPDWRWLLEREDSPWYASARLYRQTAHGQWGAVLARVGRDLLAMAG